VRGVARSSAAITIVNALPTGLGCALGIRRFVTATVVCRPGADPMLTCDPPGSSTPLVQQSVAHAQLRFGADHAWHTSLHLQSDVPIAMGLKSSSAVATATIRAVARALDAAPSDLEVARLAAEVGRSVGLSATGALDDALAGLRNGFILTDNRRDAVLEEYPAPPEWSALVYLPPGSHAPSPQWKVRFEGEKTEGQAIAEAARAHRYLEAMGRNSELVERVMGYAYSGLRSRLMGAGALAVGVSGLGPALAALVPNGQVAAVSSQLPTGVGEQFVTGLSSEGSG
jgi:shikimate kinase